MGISLENIEPKDQIDPDLTCLLCDKISEKPKVCQSCPKVFCLPCFRIEVANNDNKCPNCKIHINYDNVSYLKSPPKEWFEKTNELTIKCEDCSEAILQYSNYEEHRINCQGRLSSIDEILAPVREAANDPEKLNKYWNDLYEVIPLSPYPSKFMEDALSAFERFYSLDDISLALNLSASMFFIVANSDEISDDQIERMAASFCKAILQHKGKPIANQFIYNIIKALTHVPVDKYGNSFGSEVVEACLQVLEEYDEDPGFKVMAAVIISNCFSSQLSVELANELPEDTNFVDRLMVLSDKAMANDWNLFLRILSIFWNYIDTNQKDKKKLVASNFIEKILPMSEKHDAFRYNITGFIGNIVSDKDMTREIMSADLMLMLMASINSVEDHEISVENEKMDGFTNGLEVMSTILAHEDIELPNFIERSELENKFCFLIELLPESLPARMSYRTFKDLLKLIENGSKPIRWFFCWRWSQLTHPFEEEFSAKSVDKYCKQFVDEGIDKILEENLRTEDERSYIWTKSKLLLERIAENSLLA